jgi:hypothetical protein
VNYRIRRAARADIDLLARFNQQMAQESEDKPLPFERIRAGVAGLF